MSYGSVYMVKRWLQWFLLKRYLINQFRLSTESIHGPTHWKTVERIGLELAGETGADREVVRLFAWIHDACRENEFTDHDHGKRAAKLVEQLHGKYFQLTEEQLEKLKYACTHHTDGDTIDDATIGTCWDADRLDLGRVGDIPDSRYMSTASGKRRCEEIC